MGGDISASWFSEWFSRFLGGRVLHPERELGVMLKWPQLPKSCHPTESPGEGVTRLPVPQGIAPQFLQSWAADPRPRFPAGMSLTVVLFCRSGPSAPNLANTREDGLGVFISSRCCEPTRKAGYGHRHMAITNTVTSLYTQSNLSFTSPNYRINESLFPSNTWISTWKAELGFVSKACLFDLQPQHGCPDAIIKVCPAHT